MMHWSMLGSSLWQTWRKGAEKFLSNFWFSYVFTYANLQHLKVKELWKWKLWISRKHTFWLWENRWKNAFFLFNNFILYNLRWLIILFMHFLAGRQGYFLLELSIIVYKLKWGYKMHLKLIWWVCWNKSSVKTNWYRVVHHF